MIADTSGLIALADMSSGVHTAAVHCVADLEVPLRVPVTVLVELHHLVRRHRLLVAFTRLLEKIETGDLALAVVADADVERAGQLLSQYADLDPDFADATIVALAEGSDDFDILTLDERDFRAIRPRGAKSFRVLPADHRRFGLARTEHGTGSGDSHSRR